MKILDIIGELFSDEISIAVSNGQEYTYYRPSKRIDLKILRMAGSQPLSKMNIIKSEGQKDPCLYKGIAATEVYINNKLGF
jgi:hypothetical protein